MLANLWDKLTGKTAEAKNAIACKAGRHRWAEVVNKLGDGTKESWKVCQSCGVKE